jgi:hypothetical protein
MCDLGILGAKRLEPGDPSRSMLSQRMRRTGREHMPPIGPSTVDEAGTQLVDAWISGLRSCP